MTATMEKQTAPPDDLALYLPLALAGNRAVIAALRRIKAHGAAVSDSLVAPEWTPPPPPEILPSSIAEIRAQNRAIERSKAEYREDVADRAVLSERLKSQTSGVLEAAQKTVIAAVGEALNRKVPEHRAIVADLVAKAGPLLAAIEKHEQFLSEAYSSVTNGDLFSLLQLDPTERVNPLWRPPGLAQIQYLISEIVQSARDYLRK
jgi:hypothetical protein